MTRLTAACIAGTIALTASVGAQAPPADQSSKKMEPKTVTLTGCLAKGTATDSYILSNVVVSPMAPSATASSTSTATQPTSASQATPTTPPTTPTGTAGTHDMKAAVPGAWAIMSTSGVDLTPHVGHKVELTGTTADLTDVAPGTTMKAETMKAEMKRLTVQSVKHVSPTCTM